MKQRLIAMVCVAALLGCEAGVSAAPRNQPSAETVATQSAEYFDGQRWRTVWVSDREVVEFIAEDGRASMVPAMTAEAELVAEAVRTRLWRLPESASAAAAIRAVRQVRQDERLSPRFYRAPGGMSPMALNDTIIVRFKPHWSEQEIQTWAERNGVELVRRLAMQSHAYVVRTEPGMAALETANAIQRRGDVVSATPNWWVEAHPR